MNQLTTSFLVALLLNGAAASAQTTFRLGLRGGLNRALTTLGETNANYFYSNVSADKSAIYTWQAGVVAEATFGNFAFQPAIIFSQKGEQFNTSVTYGDFGVYTTEKTSTNRYNWLELPLNVVYTLHGDHGLQIFAGPYVALAVGGHQRGTTLTYPVYSTTPYAATPEAFDTRTAYGSGTSNRRVDAGVNFGIGYRQGPVQAQLGYGFGMLNLHYDKDYNLDLAASAAYNRGVQLTGAYFFAL